MPGMILKFKEWISNGKKRVYLMNTGSTEAIYIEQLVNSKEPTMRGKETNVVWRYRSHIASLGFEFDRPYATWEELVDALFQLPGVHTRALNGAGTTGSNTYRNQSNTHQQPHGRSNSTYERIDVRTPQEIASQTLGYAIDSAPFKKSTISACKMIVDNREPEELHSLLSRGVIASEAGTLEVGDIKIVSDKTEDHIIIERKTISDYYMAITGEDHRAHYQAERLYDYQMRHQAMRVRVLIVWIIEGEQDGRRMLYNTLPESRQMDGMINYHVAILGQHVVQAFNMHHLGYLVAKFTQGFFEQQLYYPVRTATGSQIDRKKSERQERSLVNGGDGNHGVSIPGRTDLFHVLTAFKSVNSRVANSLIESGLTLKSILDLSKDDLCKFDGIGPKLAEKIVAEFSA